MSSRVTVTHITLMRRQAWAAMFSATGIHPNLALTDSTGAEQAIRRLSSKTIGQTECSIKNSKFVNWMIKPVRVGTGTKIVVLEKTLERPEAAVRMDHKQTKVMRKHKLWVSKWMILWYLVSKYGPLRQPVTLVFMLFCTFLPLNLAWPCNQIW